MSKKKYSTKKRDIYQEVTNQIISALEQGALPWSKTWRISNAKAYVGGGSPFVAFNPTTKGIYSGINAMMLSFMQDTHGYEHGQWATFNQWKKAGGMVIKGEKSIADVIMYSPLYKLDPDDEKPLSRKQVEEAIAKGTKLHQCGAYISSRAVFNIAQVEGEGIEPLDPSEIAELQLFKKAISASEASMAEELLSNAGARVVWGNNPCYRSTKCGAIDEIHLPTLAQFQDDEAEQFSVAAHELVHWTGHESRLDRHGNKDFQESVVGAGATFHEEYAFEELVAELGASFICAKTGIEGDMQHAAYIQSWLKALKEDKKFIFSAAAAAQRAVDYIEDVVTAKQADVS